LRHLLTTGCDREKLVAITGELQAPDQDALDFRSATNRGKVSRLVAERSP